MTCERDERAFGDVLDHGFVQSVQLIQIGEVLAGRVHLDEHIAMLEENVEGHRHRRSHFHTDETDVEVFGEMFAHVRM